MIKRDSFVFYKSFYDSIRELDPTDQVQIYNAIFQYQFDGSLADLKGVAKSIFTLILPLLDTNNKRYENGCKGGKPKNNQNVTKNKPKDNQTLTKLEPKDNQNETKLEPNSNLMNNVLCIMNNDLCNNNKYIVEDNNAFNEIIDYLNVKTKQHYKTTTNKTKRLIKARLNEHFTIADFKKVIDNMCNEWLNTDMQKYLRPETLFGTKFESYLNREVKDSLPQWWDKDFKKEDKYEELAKQFTRGIIET